MLSRCFCIKHNLLWKNFIGENKHATFSLPLLHLGHLHVKLKSKGFIMCSPWICIMNLLALFKETLLHKFMENWPKNIALDQSDSQIRSSVKNLFFFYFYFSVHEVELSQTTRTVSIVSSSCSSHSHPPFIFIHSSPRCVVWFVPLSSCFSFFF